MGAGLREVLGHPTTGPKCRNPPGHPPGGTAFERSSAPRKGPPGRPAPHHTYCKGGLQGGLARETSQGDLQGRLAQDTCRRDVHQHAPSASAPGKLPLQVPPGQPPQQASLASHGRNIGNKGPPPTPRRGYRRIPPRMGNNAPPGPPEDAPMYTHDGRPRDNGAMDARAVHANLPKASVHALHPHPNTAGTPTEEPGWAPLGPSAIGKLRKRRVQPPRNSGTLPRPKGFLYQSPYRTETQGPCIHLTRGRDASQNGCRPPGR